MESPSYTIVPDSDPWLTVRQCAKRGHCHERTVRRMIQAGLLRHAFVGLGRKHFRIRASWFDQAMETLARSVEVSR